MSMPNLLPWRQQRRRRCLRFWGGMFAAAVLLTLAGVCSQRMHNVLLLNALHRQLAGAQSVQNGLLSRQKQNAPAQISPQQPQRLAWQPVLESLSNVMPSQAWLTELRYQPPSLMVIGYATAFPALSAMHDALGKIAGFTAGEAGELYQDSQGRWMFTFQLKNQE
ncbi:PilN domain-containing protein [Enterobacter sp. UNJFSC 003]|uniref:PilN domain-containing protein n=1 Tax=Enterobacter sp. UNJFSC 003 TaxID=3122077 RepID=UPI002EC54BF6|nr:PilN domain-containing protein [Serratia liquefaciens]